MGVDSHKLVIGNSTDREICVGISKGVGSHNRT